MCWINVRGECLKEGHKQASDAGVNNKSLKTKTNRLKDMRTRNLIKLKYQILFKL